MDLMKLVDTCAKMTMTKYTNPTPDFGNMATSAILINALSNLPTQAYIQGFNGVGPVDHFAA